eukprot:g29152.t1
MPLVEVFAREEDMPKIKAAELCHFLQDHFAVEPGVVQVMMSVDLAPEPVYLSIRAKGTPPRREKVADLLAGIGRYLDSKGLGRQILAAGGGVGGGGILVPLYMLFLRFRPRHAVALSNITVLGGAMANTGVNLLRRDENGRSLIDWNIIVMMEPATIGGTIVGSFLSKYLADFVLMVRNSVVSAFDGS